MAVAYPSYLAPAAFGAVSYRVLHLDTVPSVGNTVSCQATTLVPCWSPQGPGEMSRWLGSLKQNTPLPNSSSSTLYLPQVLKKGACAIVFYNLYWILISSFTYSHVQFSTSLWRLMWQVECTLKIALLPWANLFSLTSFYFGMFCRWCLSFS